MELFVTVRTSLIHQHLDAGGSALFRNGIDALPRRFGPVSMTFLASFTSGGRRADFFVECQGSDARRVWLRIPGLQRRPIDLGWQAAFPELQPPTKRATKHNCGRRCATRDAQLHDQKIDDKETRAPIRALCAADTKDRSRGCLRAAPTGHEFWTAQNRSQERRLFSPARWFEHGDW